MYKSNYEVEILVNGNPIKEYYQDGKVYIEGRKGNEFSLRIKNNGYSRILVIPTIDGLSVIDGKEASYDSGGYIVSGYSSIIIDGWRTSDKEVAKFYFTNPEDSYSERKDRKNNLGVIGVAVFKEMQNSFVYVGYSSYYNTTWLGSTVENTSMFKQSNYRCSAQASSQDLGTGFGDTKRSEVTSINFNKENYPDEVFEIYYNTKQQLENMGINLTERPRYIAPQAFPNRYCEPPKR